ncbi:MAG: succinate dehydrogenase, cytochrome b556 subunit [Pseudomonadales bacterium]
MGRKHRFSRRWPLQYGAQEDPSAGSLKGAASRPQIPHQGPPRVLHQPIDGRRKVMKTERPVNLSLTKFSFPIAAIASITHRITGVVLFVGIAYLLWLLDLALGSAEGYARAVDTLAMPLPKLVLLGVLAMLFFHIFAGVKHLLMDFHLGDGLAAARMGAQLSFVLTVLATILAGVWLW